MPLLPYQLISEHGWTQTSSTELQEFTKINVALWTIIRDFLEKITRGPLLPIPVLQGEAYNSTAMKKNLARFNVQEAKISRS